MLRLGRTADHGALWIAIAVGLGATRGKWRRRAAQRGLAGVTLCVPAGRAASAAAFATGVALEVPVLAVLVEEG